MQQTAQLGDPDRSDAYRAACPIAAQPPKIDEARHEGRAQGAGEVVTPLRPVQTTTRDAGCGRFERGDVYPELLEPVLTGARDRIAFRSLIGRDQIAASLELSRDSDAQPAGEVVVAGAAEPEARAFEVNGASSERIGGAK